MYFMKFRNGLRKKFCLFCQNKKHARVSILVSTKMFPGQNDYMKILHTQETINITNAKFI